MYILFSSLLCIFFDHRLYERFPRAANTASDAVAWNATTTTFGWGSANGCNACQSIGVPRRCSSGSKAFSTLGSGCSGGRCCCHGVCLSAESKYSSIDRHTHTHTLTHICNNCKQFHTHTHMRTQDCAFYMLCFRFVFVGFAFVLLLPTFARFLCWHLIPHTHTRTHTHLYTCICRVSEAI